MRGLDLPRPRDEDEDDDGPEPREEPVGADVVVADADVDVAGVAAVDATDVACVDGAAAVVAEAAVVAACDADADVDEDAPPFVLRLLLCVEPCWLDDPAVVMRNGVLHSCLVVTLSAFSASCSRENTTRICTRTSTCARKHKQKAQKCIQ